jgi:hypothetical protein
MSDKREAALIEQDRLLRHVHPVRGFCDAHVQVRIEKIVGFELFNTRPYHNYETWSDGYRVSSTEEGGIGDVRLGRDGSFLLVVEREDLDDAVREYADAAKLWSDMPEPRPTPVQRGKHVA